jgi:hypothetical protein
MADPKTATDYDALADQAAANATKTPAPQKTPTPATPGPPKAPASSTPSPEAPQASTQSSVLMDKAAFDAFAATHKGVLTMEKDPKDEWITRDVDDTSPTALPGDTKKQIVKNPSPRLIVTFNDKTHMYVRESSQGNKTGYYVVDPGTALKPDEESGAKKTADQIAAESAANVDQSKASAESSRSAVRVNNATAQAKEDERNGFLTPQQKIENANAEKKAQIEALQAQVAAGKLGEDVWGKQLEAIYNKHQAAVSAANADLSRKTAMSNERTTDVRTAADLTQAILTAKQTALQHSMTPEDAQNYADSMNRRLSQAGIKGTFRAPSTPVDFDPEQIARSSMSTYLGQYGATPEKPVAARTDFTYSGPNPATTAQNVVNGPDLDEETKTTIRAAIEAARRMQQQPQQPTTTMAAAPPGGTNGAVDDPRMGMAMQPVPTGFVFPGRPM